VRRTFARQFITPRAQLAAVGAPARRPRAARRGQCPYPGGRRPPCRAPSSPLGDTAGHRRELGSQGQRCRRHQCVTFPGPCCAGAAEGRWRWASGPQPRGRPQGAWLCQSSVVVVGWRVGAGGMPRLRAAVGALPATCLGFLCWVAAHTTRL